MDRILRVDMSTLRTKEEPYPEEWAALGGRALSAKFREELLLHRASS